MFELFWYDMPWSPMICSAFWPSVLGSYLAPPGWMPTSEHHCGAAWAVGAVQLSAPGADVSWLRQHLVELFQCGPRFEVNTGQHNLYCFNMLHLQLDSQSAKCANHVPIMWGDKFESAAAAWKDVQVWKWHRKPEEFCHQIWDVYGQTSSLHPPLAWPWMPPCNLVQLNFWENMNPTEPNKTCDGSWTQTFSNWTWELSCLN